MARVSSRVTPQQLKALHLRGSAKEAAQIRRDEIEQRSRAVNLLNPHEVKGEYDVHRLLFTTLGGDIRPIQQSDLATFRENAKRVGTRFKKGITAQQVINLSRKEDRDRANEQIHTAAPAGTNRGVIRFVTNAGPDSDATRHHVAVELTGYDAAIASPAEPKKAAGALVKDGLKFECDCAHHRFVFRYIATIGGYNYGRAENAYPKLRNPRLTGVACKHVLRVMHELMHNMAIRNIVATMVDRGQKGTIRNSSVVTKEQAQDISKMQARRQRDIAVRIAPKKVAKLKEAVQTKKATAKKNPEQGLFDAQRNLRKLKESGQLSQADFDVIMKNFKG